MFRARKKKEKGCVQIKMKQNIEASSLFATPTQVGYLCVVRDVFALERWNRIRQQFFASYRQYGKRGCFFSFSWDFWEECNAPDTSPTQDPIISKASLSEQGAKTREVDTPSLTSSRHAQVGRVSSPRPPCPFSARPRVRQLAPSQSALHAEAICFSPRALFSVYFR